jgi:polar amino acid transport system permease protein
MSPTNTPWQPSERELERRRVRRRDKIRRTAIATVVTLVVFGVAGWAITSSPGWPTTREGFFSWHDISKSFPGILRGFWTNVKMFLIAEVLIIVVGTAVAITRQSRTPWLMPLRIVAIVYTDLFRGLPSLIVVYLFALGIPSLQLSGVTNSLFFWSLIALVASYGAYVAEVIRAGIISIHPSQVASAEALGLSRTQTMQHVVLPQAYRRVLPPLLNDFVSLQKDTALASTVGVFESVFHGLDYANYHFNFSAITASGILFVLLTIPMARLTDWILARQIRREFGR